MAGQGRHSLYKLFLTLMGLQGCFFIYMSFSIHLKALPLPNPNSESSFVQDEHDTLNDWKQEHDKSTQDDEKQKQKQGKNKGEEGEHQLQHHGHGHKDSLSFSEKSTDKDFETAIIMSTHCIPSHPSLKILEDTIESLKYLSGLSPNSQIIITVDGLAENTHKNRKEYNLVKSNVTSQKLESYVIALQKAYGQSKNIKILVSPTNIRLIGNIKNAVNHLHPRTKYVYVLQQDLKFIREVNHTAIVKTFKEYPDTVQLVRFSKKKEKKNPHPCWNQTEPVQNINGIYLTKTPHWSDMNHLVSLDFYQKYIVPLLKGVNFPEQRMMSIANQNCTFYGPHLYGPALDGAYISHTDGTERYGQKFKARG